MNAWCLSFDLGPEEMVVIFDWLFFEAFYLFFSYGFVVFKSCLLVFYRFMGIPGVFGSADGLCNS